MDNLKIKLKIFTIGDAFHGERDILINLVFIVKISKQHSETLNYFITKNCSNLTALGCDLTPVEPKCQLFALLTESLSKMLIFG